MPFTETPSAVHRLQVVVLLATVSVIATCGLLYELLLSTVNSYFQGDSVFQFSFTIGLFMSAMGIGSWLSRYVRDDLLDRFVEVELLLGLLGGFSVFAMHLAYTYSQHYYVVSVLLVVLLGAGIGMEIPLITRLVRHRSNLRDALANVLSFDYIGAFLASLLFPLVLLPWLGTMRTAFAVGLLNIAVALINISVFSELLKRQRMLSLVGWGSLLMLMIGFGYSLRLVGFFESRLYEDRIVYAEQSRFQRIVVTQWREDVRLFLEGKLQFSTIDEYRYHEALVHLPMVVANKPVTVLILGGGDGLALREVLRYPFVEQVVLVDLDPRVVHLAKTHPLLKRINQNALASSKVQVVNQDAFKYLEETSAYFDLVLIDLPDPSSASLGKLYTTAFYKMLYHRLSAGGVAVTQASSPYHAPAVFWCIQRSMQLVFPEAWGYVGMVPSFGGEWGFVMVQKPVRATEPRLEGQSAETLAEALPRSYRPSRQMLNEWRARLQVRAGEMGFKYLVADKLDAYFTPDADMQPVMVEPNTLSNQKLVSYYDAAWRNWGDSSY